MNRRILIVEDDSEILDLGRRKQRRYPYLEGAYQ